ncbi:MAG: hypothetical protein RSG77_24205, partial [Hafnia sp.]
FKTTLAQFNITTTYKHKSYSLEYAQLTGRGAFYIVDVYSPETPNGERSQFGTLEEADEFETEMRSQGDIE